MQSRTKIMSYIETILTHLTSNPRDFWSFINSKRTASFIPDKVYFNDQAASDSQVTDLFASYFSSTYRNFSPCPHTAINDMIINEFPFLLSQLCFSHEEVAGPLNSLLNVRGLGPDSISAFFLYNCRKILCSPICSIFNKYLSEGKFPSVWKTSRITR